MAEWLTWARCGPYKMDECPSEKTSEKLGFLVRFPSRCLGQFFVLFLFLFLLKKTFFLPFPSQLEFFSLGAAALSINYTE